MVMPIHIDSCERVNNISNIACQVPFEIWLSSADAMLDARSLLGLYSLIGQDVYVVVEDNIDPDRFVKVVKKMIS